MYSDKKAVGVDMNQPFLRGHTFDHHDGYRWRTSRMLTPANAMCHA
jgi:hypothetical protein